MHYTPPPHVTQHWQLSKPSAKGRRGMVVSQAKGAAEAGVAASDLRLCIVPASLAPRWWISARARRQPPIPPRTS
jgi:gamma-glutamyltranspeptidase/glutathione hydrolase